MLQHATTALAPLGSLLGLDGAVLLAFLLGSPANEIVLPIAYMIYQNSTVLTEPAGTAALYGVFSANGWTWKTAVCFLIFCVLHWPCTTTLWTIRRETNSLRYTVLAAVLPTACGVLLCIAFTALCRLLGM